MKKLLLCFSLLCTQTYAADFYVSTKGSDTHIGSQAKPFKTLAQAQKALRKSQNIGRETCNIYIREGIYYLDNTLIFTPQDSGTKHAPVNYLAYKDEQVVLSGGSKLKLTWTAYKDGIFQSKTPEGLKIDQLFINGKSQRMARYPNYDASKKTAAYQGFAADAFSKERALAWADPAGGYIHAMHTHRWGGYHYLITGKDAKGEVTYEGGWQNNRKMGMHKSFRMVENIFEELNAAGEWYHNAKTNTLYYKPEAKTELDKASVEVVRLAHLVEFQGSEKNPVKDIAFKGFIIRHAARTFMDCKEQLLRSDWAIYRGGSFMLTGTENISILDCEFDQVGGNAIFVNNYNRRTLIKGCHIHDVGASGVCFVGDPNAVRDPLFEYGEKNDLSKIDRTPGPKTNNYPAFGVVEDCLIHGIGTVERQPAGVMMDMASEITIRDCSIYDCARSGINIGDGAWGGHLIERCDVFDTVLETHDHGSFNSWGRDRFWRSDVKPTQKAVDEDPSLPFLDAIKTTTIRDSRWRCDHGWDIDLDDGSSNYDIYNNLLLARGLKLREGFRRRAWNNITVNNGLHPHVWYNNSEDEVFSNIFMAPARGARMPSAVSKGKRVDSNLFFNVPEAQVRRHTQFGWDINSLIGDPLFVDPANGDFRVKKGSPAFKIGFKNFPMDQFGVKKPSLKAIARTPIIPALATPIKTKSHAKIAPLKNLDSIYLGATIHSIVGEEFSAYGTRKADGGVALTQVPNSSSAAKTGFAQNDLIQAVNGKAVKDIEQFFKALSENRKTKVILKVIRNQAPTEITIKVNTFVQIETSSKTNGFRNLKVPRSSTYSISTNTKTGNDKIEILLDGKLKASYGPVFANGIQNGAYKMDLGRPQNIASITSWSYNQGGNRGTQKIQIYASNSSTDPAWDLSKFSSLGLIDTSLSKKAPYTAASLRSMNSESLGKFRWVIWAVSPISSNDGGENTALQELAVKVVK
jgi:hypothetical protein